MDNRSTITRIFIPLCMFLLMFDPLSAQSLPDSLVYHTSDIDIGETFYTGYFTGFSHVMMNSFIEDTEGNLHLVYIDNYELYYYKSTDEGVTWQKEQIITGHEGDIRHATMAVDLNGKIYIGITVHPLYNYANPTGIGFGQEFYYNLYCVHNLTGTWTVELVQEYSTSNYGPTAQNCFVDSSNDFHLIANRYGWSSFGGEAWEWIRYSSSNTWSPRITIVEFTDAGIDNFIGDKYIILGDTVGRKCLVGTRKKDGKQKLFFIRNDGSGWEQPVEVSDDIAVAWNSFDAVTSPDGTVYIMYLYNNTAGLPELKVSGDFSPAIDVNINLATEDTLNYLTLHCDQHGTFTMYLWIKNKNIHISYSTDCLNWSDPIEVPDELKNYFGGMMVRTDTRRGYYTNKTRQITIIAGDRTAQPYGPDTLFYADVAYYSMPAAPELFAPANQSVIDTTSVEFVWSESYPAIDRYWFEIADNAQFSGSLIDSSLTDPEVIIDNILPDKTYYWRVKCRNFRGWGEYSQTWNFSTVVVSVEDEIQFPELFSLNQNYPNPFNPTTQISFTIPERSFVELKVYNLLGIEVASLISRDLPSGSYTEEFDASELPTGVYLYRLKAGIFTDVKKMTFIK